MYVKVARDVLSSPNGTEALVPFQQQGIFHFGVLNAETSQSSADVILKATLDVFKGVQGGLADGGHSPKGGAWPGHSLSDPGAHHMGPKFSRFEHPIRDVVELLSDRGYLDLGIPVSVSFSLKGFWYAPMHPEQDSDFAPGRPCTVNSAGYLGSYARVCNDPDYRENLTAFDDGHFVNYTFNKKKKLTFTFDSLRTITKKAVLAHHLDRRVSFTLFDVDFGDVHEECPGSVYGAFDRVAGVRWLTDRFKQLLLSADEETTEPAG